MGARDSNVALVREQLKAGTARVLRRPAAPGRALALVDAELGQAGVFWEEDESAAGGRLTMVGVDAAALLRASGPERLPSMIELSATLFGAFGPELGPWIRCFGGSAFGTGRDGSGCWEDFGDSTFLLPRVIYVDRPEGAELLALDLPGAVGGSERTTLLLEAAQRVIESSSHATSLRPEVLTAKDSAGQLEFEQLVERAKGEISAGRVDKIALARRVTLTLSVAPRVAGLLDRLQQTAAGATRFAFRIGERTFVGATPESLIRRAGLAVETEALAGTVAKSTPRADVELLTSEKDREEHAYVVRALEGALRPLCSRLEVAEGPVLKELPRLLHLCTPIRGELARPLHVLDLVGRLHPTPAVCGTPTHEAYRFIAEHEAAPRGWYAAPFGWMDARGDGHFVVGLRSALLHGKNVHLYAGAGIVRASDPRREYDETELKLESIRSALGLGERALRSASPA